MEEKPKKRLGELLVEDGLLTREHLEEALAAQKKEGGMIGQILIQLGYLSEEDLISALGRQLRLPYVSLAQYSVNMEAVHLLGEEAARRYMAAVFDVDETRAYVATSDPLNSFLAGEIKEKLKLKPQIFLSTPTEILNIFDLTFSTNRKQPQVKKAG